MTTRYYRFTSPEVMAAVADYSQQCSLLHAQASQLAQDFGGKAVYSGGISGRSFAGLQFTPPLDSPLWTKPDRTFGNVQRPRSKVRASERVALAELTVRWNALQPQAKPRTDALFEACGSNWGNLLFGGPLGYVMTETAFYLATGLTLTNGEEITGGEYDRASKEKSA